MKAKDEWTGRDTLLGGVFLLTGALVVAYALVAASKDVPARFWALGWVVGPLLLLLGLNALYQGIRAAVRTRLRSDRDAPGR